MFRWEQTLWDELDELPADQQIIATGEYITHITQELLTQLGRHRRLAVVRALEPEGMDATRLAETIGSRPTTINRLAEEGRVIMRREDAHAPV
jgi:uncharacterized protein (DUF2461 family)